MTKKLFDFSELQRYKNTETRLILRMQNKTSKLNYTGDQQFKTSYTKPSTNVV